MAAEAGGPEYHRAPCAACGVTCEQRRRTVRAGDASYPALDCNECESVCVDPVVVREPFAALAEADGSSTGRDIAERIRRGDT